MVTHGRVYHPVQSPTRLVTWLVVWNLWIIVPFSWECHHPNWRTHIFQRVFQPPTSSYIHHIYSIVDIIIPFHWDIDGKHGIWFSTSLISYPPVVKHGWKIPSRWYYTTIVIQKLYSYMITILLYIYILYTYIYIFTYTYIYIYYII